MKNKNDIQNEEISPKPDWKDAPEWANYLAQDENGEWWWYKYEPSVGYNRWRAGEKNKYAMVHIDNWKETLESRPE